MSYNKYMKVLIVFVHPTPYKVKFFNELSKYVNLEVIFLRHTASDRDPKFYNENKYNFKTHFLSGISIGAENHLSFQLRTFLKKNYSNYDCIVMNGYSSFTEILATKYLQKKKIPYVLYINGGIVPLKESSIKRKIKTKLISGANLYLSPCKSSNEYLLHYGADANQIKNYSYSTIYEQEIQKPLSSAGKIALREENNIICEKLFISVGQFIPRKNFLTLLEIWKNVPKTNELYLIGGGPEHELYADFIKLHNLDNVTLMNFMSHKKLINYFAMADGFIFLSKEDIYGHVINESLSNGVGVISSNKVNSAKHLIKDGYNGFIVDLDNLQSITSIIKNFNADDLYLNAIKTAKENTIETMTKQIYDVLKEFINE